MKKPNQTLEFPVQVGQAERVAYEVLAAVVGKHRAAAAFMAAKGITHAMIAQRLGCHYTRPGQILRMSYATGKVVRSFQEQIGFPECVLPLPKESKAA